MALKPKSTHKPKAVKPVIEGEDDEAKVASAASEGSDDDVPPSEETETEESEGEAEPAAEKTALPPAAQPLGEVDTRVDTSMIDKEDLVIVTMHETIDPAPRIGNYDIKQKLGKPKLEAKKNYRLPKYVAEVLVDAKKAEFINFG